jgi:hypothetical protein
MNTYPDIRERALSDYQREIVRALRSTHLQPVHRPPGVPPTRPVNLRLHWQLTDAGSRPRVRAAWFR